MFYVREDVHDEGHAEQTPDRALDGAPVQVRGVRQALQAHLAREGASEGSQQRPAVRVQQVQQDLQDGRT